jgi:hypothetical protein
MLFWFFRRIADEINLAPDHSEIVVVSSSLMKREIPSDSNDNDDESPQKFPTNKKPKLSENWDQANLKTELKPEPQTTTSKWTKFLE